MFQLKNSEFTAKQIIESYFFIVDRDRHKAPFVFNNIQNTLFESMTHRTLVLKYRKGGISSQVLALWDCACIFEDNARAVVISHEKEATKRLLDRVYYYNDNLVVKPKIDRASADEIHFPETNSSFYIGTAGSRAFGRGDDITHLHISEFDWWEHTEMLTGLLEACTADAWVVIETTANGFNSKYHKLWQKAVSGQSEFKPVFFGWNLAEECKKNIETQDFVLSDEERKLKAAYKLSDEQINWRRWKLRTMDKPELFPQEFPINDVEAFMASGRQFFDGARLKLYLDNCTEPIARGELKKTLDRVEFVPNNTGSLKIYKKPIPGRAYVIGGDVAEGIEEDRSCATVYDPVDNEVVATLQQDIDPSSFGRELAKLGQFYNWALIACEVNNHGLTSLTVLKEQECYPLIYYRKTVDKATNEETSQIGWKTTETTRPLLLDKFDKAIREGLAGIRSKDTISECISFIINKNGKPEHVSGGHDDFVFSTAIAYYIAPMAKQFIKEKDVVKTPEYQNTTRWQKLRRDR